MTDNTTLTQAHQNFIDHLNAKGRSTSTILAYGKDIEQLMETCAQSNVKTPPQVTTDHIEAFKAKLSQDGYTPKSTSRKINSVKAFFRFLKTQGLISDNPAISVTHPKYEVAPPRILSKMEYRALRDACRKDERVSAIVEVLLQTGIRIGELASLSLEDLDLNKKTIYIRAYESHQERTVPINSPALTALDHYLKVRPKTRDKTIFITKTGRPFLVRNIRTAIDRFFRLAGIKGAKVNDLRHTFVSEQLAAGTPLTYVSKLVGHKRLSTTEKYLKFLSKEPEKKEEIKLEEL